MGVMEQIVLVPSDQFQRAPAGNLVHRPIGESGVTLQINSVDAVSHRIKDQIVLSLQMQLRALQFPVQPHHPSRHHEHGDQKSEPREQPIAVFRYRILKRELSDILVWRQSQLPEQLMHRLVVQRNRPAGVVPSLGCWM